MFAVDYSYARPDPQALYNAGYRVVMRYLGADNRCITGPELQRLHDAQLLVGFIGQSTVDRPRTGYHGGQYDASRYNTLADHRGVPAHIPIFYTVDVGDPDGPGGRPSFPLESDLPAIRGFFQGLLDAPGRPVGMYGPYWVLEACKDLWGRGRHIECFWQTAGASGPGAGTGGSIKTGDGSVRRLSELSCMFQHVGLTGAFGNQIDHNTVHMEPVTWAWNPQIATITEKEEDDMINWRPVHCPEISGDAQWLLTFDGNGRPRRLGLGPDDPQMYWALGHIQTVEAIEWKGAQAEKFMAIPEALPEEAVDPAAVAGQLRQPLIDAVTAVLQAQNVDVDENAIAEAVATELAGRLVS
jgi:hypothetical protein